MRKRDVLLFILVVGIVIMGLNQIGKTNGETQQEIVQQAVERAVIQCYAIEGMYPADINYIKDHYGIQIDESQYVVHYESFGTNIMPNIKVIAKH